MRGRSQEKLTCLDTVTDEKGHLTIALKAKSLSYFSKPGNILFSNINARCYVICVKSKSIDNTHPIVEQTESTLLAFPIFSLTKNVKCILTIPLTPLLYSCKVMVSQFLYIYSYMNMLIASNLSSLALFRKTSWHSAIANNLKSEDPESICWQYAWTEPIQRQSVNESSLNTKPVFFPIGRLESLKNSTFLKVCLLHKAFLPVHLFLLQT